MRTEKHPKQNGLLPRVLILVGVVILVILVLVVKKQPQKIITATNEIVDVVEKTEATAVTESPEVQLERHMKEGKPTFVFYHSNNCQTCIDMIAIVNQVYPEFQESVALVDVNVYDPVNKELLQKARINSIPTQVFINASGEGKIAMGLMPAEIFRQQLLALVESSR